MDNRSPILRFGILSDGKRSSYWRVRAGVARSELFLDGLPWHDVPVLDRTRDQAHGRVELRTLKAVTVWTVTAIIPLTYAIWLPEGLRRHAIDGALLVGDGEQVAPVGVNLADALVFCLGIFPVLGLTLGVIGAGLGAQTTHRAVPNDPS